MSANITSYSPASVANAVSGERLLEGFGQDGLAAAAKQVGRVLLQQSLLSQTFSNDGLRLAAPLSLCK
jgi:hypothetical protein